MTLAYAMIFTLPGIPSIYYGDEIGMRDTRTRSTVPFFDWEEAWKRAIRPVLQNSSPARELPAFADGTVGRGQGACWCYLPAPKPPWLPCV